MVSQLEQSLLAGMLFVIMFGMGSALTLRDFTLALKRPYGLMIALFSQFGLMPLIAFSLALALDLPPPLAIGLLIMGVVPGGTTSNIFSYFAKGNLALSLLMTVNSTIFALILTPAMLYLYGQKFETQDIQIPMSNIIATLVLLLLPVIFGMLVRKWNANVGALLEFFGSMIGIIFILFLIVSWVPRNWQLLIDSHWTVYAASIGLGLVGFSFGLLVCRFFKIDRVNSQTIALETGIQNGPLAIGIVLLSFSDEIKDSVLLVPALYSLFIVITATIVTIIFRRINSRNEQQVPALL